MEEDNNVANNTETTKLGGITGKGFMPGVSGNPSGRPKDTLKAFIARELREMSDDEKREWVKTHKIPGIDQWKMGEGLPDSKTEATNTTKVLLIDKELAELYGIRVTPETETGSQEPSKI